MGGVLSGVLLGVDEALSTLAFLEPERGVMFEFKRVLTGTSCLLSRAGAFWFAPCFAPLGSLRSFGVVAETGDRTVGGVWMPLAVHLEALAGVEVLGLGFPFGG